jgi:AcrR family transcriptional regulator
MTERRISITQQIMTSPPTHTKRRVPAAERRNELIDAAVVEFAQGGMHGTPVDRIARRVGIAQPYVFSLFPSKRELFIAALERGFDRTAETFSRAAGAFDPEHCEPGMDVLTAMGRAYIEMLSSHRELLMLQLHGYAACDDEVIRERVRSRYADLVRHVAELSGATSERLDDFMRAGMWLNVQAAMGVDDLSAECDWIRAEMERSPGIDQ